MKTTKVFLESVGVAVGRQGSHGDCDICDAPYTTALLGSIIELRLAPGEEPIGLICPECVEKGPDGLAETMLEAADDFERQARLYRRAAKAMKGTRHWELRDSGPLADPLPKAV